MSEITRRDDLRFEDESVLAIARERREFRSEVTRKGKSDEEVDALTDRLVWLERRM